MSLLALVVSAGCEPSKDDATKKKVAPAKVAMHPDEHQLATITLTEQAEERLGIQVARAERKKVERRRTVGGEVVVPPGQSVTVSAPVAGTIGAPPDAVPSAPGSAVSRNQPLLTLAPRLAPDRQILTPTERVQLAEARTALASSLVVAEGDVKRAEVEVEAARIALARAEKLLEEKAGSQRVVEETTAQLRVSQRILEAAEARRDLLQRKSREFDARAVEPLVLRAPQDGVLMQRYVSADQMVAAGEPLFAVTRLDPVWIRVPVYAGDVTKLDTNREALLDALTGSPDATPRTVRPVEAPPSADAHAASVDLFYAEENKTGALRPGQRVTVTLFLREDTERLVIPASAVLHDAHGGTWVYQRTAPRIYRRRRIEVAHVADAEVHLARGLEAGDDIVTDGAAELFGTEFGNGK